MPIVDNPELYEQVKRDAEKVYKKSSGFRSGWIVKTYKERGGTYTDDKKPKMLKSWFRAKWEDISPEESYPTYRPTKRVSKKTPLLVSEIDPKNLKKQIALKQKIKGSKLPPFLKKDS